MRYPTAMALLMTFLVAVAVAAVPAAAGQDDRAAAAPAPALRYTDGASASATVSARIISAPARVGAGFGPPMARMEARRTFVSAADGRAVAAIIYDFE